MDDEPITATTDDLTRQIEIALVGPTEDTRVRAWRLDQFLALGFGLVDSSCLAASDADVAGARGLIARGCPPHLATRILV